ncbi:S8 family peptidase [Halegenticoccus soli]|uniref:S8 family peptidase n=1 Tax=Halegenticoccus soli TaxID=1985678 RepID=UPI000C6D6165|nr:S8 family peptidase [Halegenticoccus soli]
MEAVQTEAAAVHQTLDFGRIGGAVVGTFPSESCSMLSSRSDVRYVEPDGILEATGHGSSGTQTIPWGVDRIDADEVHHDGYTGRGADIAIIDTGIDSDHPDLQANLGAGNAYVPCGTTVSGEPCTQSNGNDCLQPWDDDNDHGTHVAGTADAVNNAEGVVGVSTRATLHALKALDCNGQGYYSDVAAAIVYTADQGWEVANLSLGGDVGSQTVHDACKYAYRNGVLLVAAAGNDGCEGCVDYPAAYPEVIAVSATTRNDAVASFSSTGPQIELAAPGAEIYSTVAGGYATFSGTSMAAPHVAGAGAQLMVVGFNNANNVTYDESGELSQDSYENPDGARGRLRQTAEDLDLPASAQGYGLVDVEAALAIGESGTVSVDQPDRNTWRTVSLRGAYDDPVVIMKPVSYNGVHPAHVRLRNVQSESFEFQIEEWAYQDGKHVQETIQYIVMESSTYVSSAGNRIEVGTMTTNHQFTERNFTQNFTTKPVIFAQSQTHNGPYPIAVRQRNTSSTSTEIRLQEEEGLDGIHVSETVGYMAIEPGVFNINGTQFEVGRTPDAVTDTWYNISFTESYETPLFLADLQTFDGSDTATLRYRNLSSSGVEISVQEEQSRDTETQHTTEVVGYGVIETGGLI